MVFQARMPGNIGKYRESISNNSLEETVLKIVGETGVTIDSKDVEACHHLNQSANPKKVIIKMWPGQ